MKRLSSLLLFWLLPAVVICQTPAQPPVGWSTSADTFIKTILRDWHVPGLAIAIVKGNKVIYKKGYGFCNVEEQLPVTEKTQYPIASLTKPFTRMIGLRWSYLASFIFSFFAIIGVLVIAPTFGSKANVEMPVTLAL